MRCCSPFARVRGHVLVCTLAIHLLAYCQTTIAAEPASSTVSSSSASSTTASSSGAGAKDALPAPVPYKLSIAIEGGVAVMLLVSLLMIRKSLRVSNWSLAQALSEKQAPNTAPPQAGTPTPLVPSTSRLIALLGTVIIGTFFTGIGFYVIWQTCNGQPLSLANAAWGFFATGATLFLPYGINKFTAAF